MIDILHSAEDIQKFIDEKMEKDSEVDSSSQAVSQLDGGKMTMN